MGASPTGYAGVGGWPGGQSGFTSGLTGQSFGGSIASFAPSSYALGVGQGLQNLGYDADSLDKLSQGFIGDLSPVALSFPTSLFASELPSLNEVVAFPDTQVQGTAIPGTVLVEA